MCLQVIFKKHFITTGPAFSPALAGLLGLVLAACAGPSLNPELFAENTRRITDFYQTEYRINTGDMLQIYVDPDLNASPQEFFTTFNLPVRPDGRIAVPPVGEFVVRGHTSRELAGEIAARFPDVGLGSPRVTVQVTKTDDWYVYVEGEVRKTGPVDYQAGLTLTKAVGAAGGVHYLGDDTDVVIARVDPENAHAAAIEMSLDEVWSGEASDLPLLPGDVVHVKPTSITKVNRWFQQYIWGILPFNVGATSLYYP